MNKIIILMFCTMNISSYAQVDLKPDLIYVCPPCNMECDNKIHHQEGICIGCGMQLVLRESIIKTEEFAFTFDSIKYSGFIDLPRDREPTALVLLVPGHGRTDFANGAYYELRQFFTQIGLATAVWDKAGCGKSEGNYNHNQSLQSSANEVKAAISQLKSQKIPSSDQIGMWGISRAGWICPLVMEQDETIAFWISVSGTDQLDNYRYLLETNLRIAGRSEFQINLLMNEWDYRISVLLNGGVSYEDYLESTKNLFSDSLIISLGIARLPKDEIYGAPDYYKNSGDLFDKKTGLQIMVPNFDRILKGISCPVLAIFGEQDSQVNWRNTRSLYESTIGGNEKTSLTVVTLPNCNHNIMTCETGGYYENLEKFGRQSCNNYYESMTKWLQEKGFTE